MTAITATANPRPGVPFNVDVKKVFAWGPKVDRTIVDINEGRLSYSSADPIPVSQLDSPRGGYFVVDGHHRIVEAILNGKKTIAAVINAEVPRIERTGGAHRSVVAEKVNVYNHVRGIKKNPIVGMYPDLFEQKHQYPEGRPPVGDALRIPVGRPQRLSMPQREYAGAYSAGDTPVFVSLDELTSEQIRKLPRLAFSNDEWDELDEDDAEWIEDHDVESEDRVNALAAPFIQRYKWELEGDRDFSYVEDGLEYYLRDRANRMYEQAPDSTFDDIVQYATERGVTEADVIRILNEILVDTNNYTIEQSGGADGIYSEEIRGNVYIERSEYIDELEACTPDEVERAIKKIDKDTDFVVDVSAAQLVKNKYSLEFDFDTGNYMNADVDWDNIERLAKSAIDEVEIPDDVDIPGAAPPEARVVYRWPDGFYVQDLLPSELPMEGKTMGMCVGRPDMGYGKAVRDGEIKILSLRRPSGKPLFTIEASLDRRSLLGKQPREITSIDQIKGKANRKPGFDLGADRDMTRGVGQHEERYEISALAAAKAMKRDEVARVLDYVISITHDPAAIEDLQPAMAAISLLRRKGDVWAIGVAAKIPDFEQHEEPAAAPAETPEEGEWLVRSDAGQRIWRATSDMHARELHHEAYPHENILEVIRTNPASACPMGHGEGCTGFCLPYQPRAARNPSRHAFKYVGTEEVLEAIQEAEPSHEFIEPPDHSKWRPADLHRVRSVTWLGSPGYLVAIPVENINFMEGNAWNFGHGKALLDGILDGTNRVLQAPAGRVYRVMASDVKMSQKYERDGELSYQLNMNEPWTKAEMGQYHAQLLDGNHRAAAAILAGDPFIYVYVSENTRENVRKKDLE